MNNKRKEETMNNNGTFKMIDVDNLTIDMQYQRGVVSKSNTKRLSDNFDWSAFGTITVFNRNGCYYVVDGQQRLTAAVKNGIKTVPCMVFDTIKDTDEAKSFILINTNRKAVKSHEKYRAAVNAKFNPEYEIFLWLSEQGIHVSSDASSPNVISFPYNLIKTWKVDSISSKKAIFFQKKILMPGQTFSSILHRGIWHLLHRGINLDEHISKINNSGGKEALLRSIKNIAIITNSKENNQIAARGILDVINKKRHKKIKLD